MFKTNQLPLPIGGPQGFVLTSPVVAYDAVGRIQYILGGAVILLQLNDLCPGKCLLEAQNIPYIRPSEPVNGLVVIPHHTQVPVLGSQQADQLKLGQVGVLIFVHHDILKPLLVVIQDLAVVLEQLYCLYYEVVEVQGIVLPETLLVLLIYLPNPALPEVLSCI